MDEEFFDFKAAVSEINRAYELVLECARNVLWRAAEIDPNSRSYMIESLVEFISGRANNEDRT